jgi:beta-lactamase regulating signal transducer with metallopeptidase domain
MEDYLTQITNYLLTQSWQIAILVIVITAVNLALKNKSAHIRYLLWLIVLAKCLVPPLFTVPVAVLPQEKPIPLLETPPAMISEPSASTPASDASPPTTAPRRRIKPVTTLTSHQWLGFGWIVGVAAFAIFAVTKALRTNFWLWRQRRLLPAELQAGIENLFSSLGIKTLPKVWLVEGIGQPFVWGLLRGSIYLPADFIKVNGAEHRKGVLGHELSHILRFDAAVNILQIIAQVVFWFHPFVWWANKKIRAEREKCCDEMAIARLGAKAKDYSSAIVNILISEHKSTRPVPSLAVAGPVKNIEERIKTMLRPGKKFYKHPSLPAVAIVVLTALLAVPTSVVLTARAEATPIFGNPTNLGPMVNSSTRTYEWDPHISPDGLELYFLLEWERPDGSWYDDIWVTTRKAKNEPWGPPVNLGPPVNTGAFEGAPCLSADSLELYFVSDRPGGSGSVDILVTKRKTKDSSWGPPVNLGPKVNSAAAENGPSISADSLELYFSDAIWSSPPPRPGGMGGADIWVTKRESKNELWGPPVNLGPTVNSSAGDVAPSISTDGLSLYFISKRPGGFGDMDIWVTTRKTKNDPWGTPVNLGQTVNSPGMENNPDISSDGSTLYFVSGRPGNVGGDGYVDIWQVSLKAHRAKE